MSNVALAEVVGSFNGLTSSDYSDIWKVQNASPQALIFDEIIGGDDLHVLSVGTVTVGGCEIDVQSLDDSSGPSFTFIDVNTIVAIGNVYVGVVQTNLTPLRCLVGYNFDLLGPIDSSPSEVIEEVPEAIQEVCEETDGGYAGYAVGTMTHNFDAISSPVTDFCIDANTVQEYYCNSDLLDGSHVDQVNCPYGCDQGRCLYDYEVEQEQEVEEEQEVEDVCEDSDGGFDLYEQGSMTLNDVVQNEYCIDADSLQEYSCGGTSWDIDTSIEASCVNGCVDGRCLTDEEVVVDSEDDQEEEEEEDEEEVFITSCVDSDFGVAPHVFGSVTLVAGPDAAPFYEEGEEIVYEDVCNDDVQLREYSCNEDADLLSNSVLGDCPGGCLDGVCQTSFCEETDGGYERYVAGTMTHDYAMIPSPVNDYCFGSSIVEYSCGYNLDDNDPTNDNMDVSVCAHGCVSDPGEPGRCRTFTESLGPAVFMESMQSVLDWILNLLFGN